MSLFKKKGGQVTAANVHMTEAEAALAQSDFNIEKITEIQNKFAGGVILLVPGRIFIREGLLYKVCRKGLKKRQFFLFNDILVYGSIVAGLYSNQQILPLSQMSVSSDCFYQPRVDADFISETDEENLDVANAFQISHANKSFHVFGQSAADKANWIANLQKHITRVAKSVSDSQQQVLTRPVWVPDSMTKECMICSTKFTAFLRKHHCRRCGRVICSSCSPHRVSLISGEMGVVSRGTEGGGKLERTCRECFKEMTAVHNRANSMGSNKHSVTKTPPTSPPPPTVAAQIVSNALRLVTTSPVEESPNSMDTSTDTEDSDDSGNEELVTKPVPAKRSSTIKVNNETSKPVPVVRNSLKEETTPPIPRARQSFKNLSNESTPSLDPKMINQIADDDEPQPTPPPRKKKQLKQKLKEQQKMIQDKCEEGKFPGNKSKEEESLCNMHEEGDNKNEEGESPGNKSEGRESLHNMHEGDNKSEEGESLHNMHEGDNKSEEGESPGDKSEGGEFPGNESESPDNKRARRRNKFKPQEDNRTEDSNTENEGHDNVNGGAGEDVESGTGDVVESGAGDAVEGCDIKPVDGVSVNGTIPQENSPTTITVTNTESHTETKDSHSETKNSHTETGDTSLAGQASPGKRTGRRRNKFKQPTPAQ